MRPQLRVLAFALATTLSSFGALACAPKTGADRFVGTFRWRLMFGYQAVTLEPEGKASYVIVTPGEGDNDKPETETFPGTYRVAGDTAFLAIEWSKPEDRGDTLALLLRGDTLVSLSQILGGVGGHSLYIRD